MAASLSGCANVQKSESFTSKKAITGPISGMQMVQLQGNGAG
jgi:hypothetical protein